MRIQEKVKTVSADSSTNLIKSRVFKLIRGHSSWFSLHMDYDLDINGFHQY